MKTAAIDGGNSMTAAALPAGQTLTDLSVGVTRDLFVDKTTGTRVLFNPTQTGLIIQNTKDILEIPLTPDQVSALQAHVEKRGAQEIEKKYEVLGGAFMAALNGLNVKSTTEISQGYAVISKAGDELRVREKVKVGRPSYTLTIKGSGDLVRGEVEIPVSQAIYKTIMDKFVGQRTVEKTRYEIDWRGFTLEVDAFHAAGPSRHLSGRIYRGEVEVSDTANLQSFEAQKPPFFGRDLTADKLEKNKVLAERGFVVY